jgi:hypothetical protein
LNLKDGPVTAKGKVRMGYFFACSWEALQAIRRAAENQAGWPSWAARRS